MTGKRRAALDDAGLIDPDAQPSGGGHRRVLLPNATGGCVSGIGEETLTLLELGLVERFERGVVHVDLAPHLEQRGHVVSQQPQRDLIDRSEVGGDVLAGRSITTSCALNEHAILVRQHHGEPVDLELAGIALGLATELAFEPLLPSDHVFLGLGIVEREQRTPVLHG